MMPVPCDCPAGVCNTLARRFCNGDANAGEEIARTYRKLVSTIVLRTLGASRREEWEDVTQIAILQCVLATKYWREECPFCRYIAVVAARCTISYVRRNRPNRHVPLSDAFLADKSPPSDVEFDICYQAALQQLPVEDRMAWQHRSEGVSAAEIASRLGLRVRTVYYRLDAIKSFLAKALADFDPGAPGDKKME